MSRDADGWFELVTAAAGPGSRYRYRLDDGCEVPDPGRARAARRRAWRRAWWSIRGATSGSNPAWAGRPWARGGALRAARRHVHARGHVRRRAAPARPSGRARRHRDRADAGRRLPGPAQLGLRRRAAVRARSRLRQPGRPQAPGRRGARPRADGVPRRRLQPLRARRQLSAAAGAASSSPSDAHTPWGAAIDFTPAAPVRDFFIHNALYWLEEYRFDGLRLDAVHAIRRPSEVHILTELAATRAPGRRPRAPRPPGARERRQPGALPRARRGRPAAATTTRSGTTTSTTRRTCC